MAFKILDWADEVNLISRWIPFDIARPLLDRKPYAVLSDFAMLQNAVSPPRVSENVMEVQHDDVCQDSNDLFMDEDEEMTDPGCESSDDESGPESSNLASVEIEDGDISNIVIELNKSRFRYKVCIVNLLGTLMTLQHLIILSYLGIQYHMHFILE